MAETVKLFLVPGSIPFLVAGLVAGIGCLYGTRAMQRWARRWLTGLLAVYAFLATPAGADLLATPLVHRFTPLTRADDARGAGAMVVLSVGCEVYRADGLEVAEMGKATSYNAIEGARLYRLLDPPVVIASGGIVRPGQQQISEGQILSNGLQRLGVPAARIVVEERSRTTREQAVEVADVLGKRGVRRFVLVTASDHMARALGAFRQMNLDPIPSVSTFLVATPPGIVHRFRPGLDALRQSDWACYEYLARVYYWSQGWLGRR